MHAHGVCMQGQPLQLDCIWFLLGKKRRNKPLPFHHIMRRTQEVTHVMEISLCMIVKDEETVLKRCLDGICDCVDELILVDTGSTDRTKEIAKAYRSRLFEIPWQDDFAAARNFSFSQATKDYILWLDADDFIDREARSQWTALKEVLDREQPDVVFCPYDVGELTFRRERLIRRCEHARWSGRVHECIAPFGKTTFYPFHVRHLSSEKDRGMRNLHIYQKWATQEPLSPRDLFYYGRELYYHKLYLEAIAVLKQAIAQNGWYVNQIEACKILSHCYLARGDCASALMSLFESFRFAEPRASVLCEIGHMFRQNKQFSEAIFWYESAMRCRDHSEEGDFEEPLCRTLAPMLGQVASYYALGDVKTAFLIHEQTEAQFPDHPSVRYNRQFFRQSD